MAQNHLGTTILEIDRKGERKRAETKMSRLNPMGDIVVF